MQRNLILCNLYKKLCIKLVSIKELYYDTRPTKSQDLKRTAIISLNSINRLVFAMGTVSFYRAVRIGFLYVSKNSIRLLKPASQRGGPGLIPGHSMWIHVDKVTLGQYFGFPCQCHSTDGPYSCGQSDTGTILRFPLSVSFH